MIKEDKIFLGHTPSEQRKFVVYYLKEHKKKFPKIHIPCVGEFSLVKAAISAGYKTTDISTSDISLFSTLLGHYFMDEPISTINFKLKGVVKTDYEAQKCDLDRIAIIFYHMRINQYRDYFFEQIKVNEVKNNKDEYIMQIKDKIETMYVQYEGITYSIEDVRKALVKKPKTVCLINPPAFSKGYEKMFDFKQIKFDSGIEEFDFKKEYLSLFKKTQKVGSPFLWYRYRDLKGINTKFAIFGKQYPKGRIDYWLINNLKFYDGKKIFKAITPKEFKSIKGLLQFTAGKIKPDSKIRIFQMKEESALYYRDLWAHKLGSTKAELYLGLVIDGKLFGVVGFMLRTARALKSDAVLENFGFCSPHPDYWNLNRLLMYCLTCKDTQDFIYHTNRTNQIYKINQFRTTCLSKYRKVKLNNGILKIEKREKEGAFYKIMYYTEFYQRKFEDCIKLYLKELAEK